MISRTYLSVLCLLLPLKFGIAINNGEIAFFPLSFFEWQLTPWPPFLLPVLAGIGLLLATIAASRNPGFRPGFISVLAPASLSAACLIGLIATTEYDYAQLFLWNSFGVTALALAAALQAARDKAFGTWALWAMTVGMLVAALAGWQQVKGGGFERTADYVRQLNYVATEGTNDILARLERGRASGPFVYPNSFAAHLILLIPAAGVLFWRLGRYFSPKKISCPLFAGAVLILAGGALYFTASRAAFVAAGCAVLAVAALVAWRNPDRFGLASGGALLAILLAGTILVSVNRGRSLSSVGARGHYYRAALTMFARKPLTGVGLGEFFPWYMRLKPSGAEDTRVPHSAVMLFASQCGIAGVAAVLFWGVGSLWLLVRRRREMDPDDPLSLAILAGCVAWLAHSMVDFNLQIPGTFATFTIMVAIGSQRGRKAQSDLPEDVDNQPVEEKPGLRLQAASVLLAVICFAGIWRLPGELAYQQFYQAAQMAECPLRVTTALAELARRKLPLSPYPDIVLSKRAAAEGDIRTSEAALTRGLKRAPHRGSLWYALAETRAALGDIDGARKALKNALKWNPTNPARTRFEPPGPRADTSAGS